jgi:hypothetical protein
MRCSFCKQYVNENRRTTFYTFVPCKNGTMKKVRWCKPCQETRADQIDKFLREHEDPSTSSEGGSSTLKLPCT